MKLIIDIEDDQYKAVQDGMWCGSLYEELKNGIPVEQCGDCISRQAVLDINERHHGQMPNHVNHEIWKEIKALPSVTPQQKWILCKDRMPDYHQLVLTFDGEYICVEQRIPYIIDENGNKHIGSEWWVDVNYVTDSELYSGLRDGAAVAWMPLPTPPNKSEIPTGQIVANGELYPGEFDDPLVAEGSDKE